MTGDDEFTELDAQKLSRAELDETWLTLADAVKYVVEIMGFTREDLQRGLMAGKITSIGDPDGRGGYRNIKVQVGGLVRWMAYLMQTDKRPKN